MPLEHPYVADTDDGVERDVLGQSCAIWGQIYTVSE